MLSVRWNYLHTKPKAEKSSPNDKKLRDTIFVIIEEFFANYTAMIVQKDNPQLENIIRDFDEFVGFFQNKPQ